MSVGFDGGGDQSSYVLLRACVRIERAIVRACEHFREATGWGKKRVPDILMLLGSHVYSTPAGPVGVLRDSAGWT